MIDQIVDVLLVEDNPDDVALALHAFKKNNFSNRVHVVRDGAEALEYIFCTGAYAGRKIDQVPKFILLDLKLPKVDGLEVLKRIKSDPRTKTHAGRHDDVFPRGKRLSHQLRTRRQQLHCQARGFSTVCRVNPHLGIVLAAAE